MNQQQPDSNLSHASQPSGSTSQNRPSLEAELAREIEEALGGLNLDEMLQSRPSPVRNVPVKGERPMRSGKVVRVHDGEVFIEFDPKRQGVCPVGQFEAVPNPGETYDFVEERFDPYEQLWVVSRRGATQRADWNNLQEGMMVEARCVGMNKGGLDMEVAHHKAFMPASQVDIRHLPDISVLLGEKFPCKILELRKEKGRMVLSRKAALLEERGRMREQLLNELEVGQTRTATITSIQQYGAFADLGGVDGLIHIGDMTHERIKDPGQVVKVGDVVEVRILKIDRTAKPIKISLGRKQTLSDPSVAAMEELQEGGEVSGSVTRLTEFGAFVELSPGVEGLIHVSEVAHERIPTPAKVLRVGEVVQCKILGIDRGKKRISLSRKALLERPAMPAQPEHKGRSAAPAVPLREEDPSMRKLRLKFGAAKKELKGGLS